MTPGEWFLATVVALGGGGGIALVVKAVRPPPSRRPVASVTPPPLPSGVSREELAALRAELKEAIEEVEDALRSRLDENVRGLIDRMHELALKVERIIAAHSLEDRESRDSRRGGRR